jgi:hypothetical protein
MLARLFHGHCPQLCRNELRFHLNFAQVLMQPLLRPLNALSSNVAI